MAEPEIVFISTNANLELAESIVVELSTYMCAPLSKTDIIYFSNGEIKVKIGESVRGKNVYILGTGAGLIPRADGTPGRSLNDHLMETMIACSACKTSDARSITVILPCFPYARQDKKHRSREPITARLVCDLLQTSGATRIVAMDLHSDQIQGFASIPFDNLFAEQCMIASMKKNLNLDTVDWVIASPDAGALKRARHLADQIDKDVVILEKERDYSTPNKVLKSTLIGKVRGKKVFITDDMCDTAGTLVAGVETLMAEGAKEIHVGITHGILSGPALDRLNDCKAIKTIFVSDTISQTQNREYCPKIHVYSVAGLIARAVEAIQHDKSISRLFI